MIVFLVLVLIFSSFLIFRTLQVSSKQIDEKIKPESFSIPDSALENFCKGLAIPTISNADTPVDDQNFTAFLNHLKRSFPVVFQKMDVISISTYSRIFIWKQKSPSKKPVLLISHYDVVPVEEETTDEWIAPPFGAQIVDDYIYARGALDNKMNLFSILQALETLLQTDFKPSRDIYFAFGHDEEIGGREGAFQIGQYFEKLGIHFDFVLDEGSVVIKEILPFVNDPLAIIAIAEKGLLNLQLFCEAAGEGHSSMPSGESNIGILAKAIARLERNPFPPRLTRASKLFFQYLTPHLPFFYRLLFANIWLTEKIIIGQLNKKPASRALCRTTIAPTIFKAGIKNNILAGSASAIVNFRILPGETIESTINYVRKTIRDERVEIEIMEGAGNPLKSSAIDHPAFKILKKCINGHFPEAIVAPSLSIATTDSRHYRQVCDNIFRFIPVELKNEDLARIHGVNERVSVKAFKKAIQFYYCFLCSLNQEE